MKDAYSLPRIDETLDCLNVAQWFTSLDFKSGYWQVEIDEKARHSLHLQWGHWAFIYVSTCPLVSQMQQLHFKD